MSSSWATWPVTLEIRGMWGFEKVIVLTICSHSAKIGSMRGEWNAWDTDKVLVLIFCCCKTGMIFSNAVWWPERTRLRGPLYAAIVTSVGWASKILSISSVVANTETIPPPWGIDCMRRPLAAINFNPSSKLKTPATQAATYSPTLWPITILGWTPQDFHNSNRAYSTAKRIGWV